MFREAAERAAERSFIVYRILRGVLSKSDVAEIFRTARDEGGIHQHSLKAAHSNRGAYGKISALLSKERGMEQPFCIQSFFLEYGQDEVEAGAHIDAATAVYDTITNVWMCEESTEGELFAVLEEEKNQDLYVDLKAAFRAGDYTGKLRGPAAALYQPKAFPRYTPLQGWQVGDLLLFDSRQAHRRCDDKPRSTVVLKYIDAAELTKPSLRAARIDYSKLGPSPQWPRFLVFDRLRFFDTQADREQYLYDTRHLL